MSLRERGRGRNKKVEAIDYYECHTYVDLDHHIKECQDFMANHTDCNFEVSTEPDYGSERAVCTLSGWRPATPTEIAERDKADALAAQQRREWEDRQIEHLRASRPEVFK